MRRLAFLVASAASAAVVVAGAGPAYADNDLSPHVKTSSTGTATTWGSVTRCAGCHRAHQAQGEMLLTKSTEKALCDTCHNGSGASTNVEDGISVAGAGGALRGGGFNNAAIDSANPTALYYFNASRGSYSLQEGKVPAKGSSTATTSNHLLGATAAYGLGISGGATGTLQTTDSGVTSDTPLECGSCHDPHGNGNFRILKPIPGGVNNASLTITAGTVATNVATFTTSVEHYLGVGNTVTISGVGAPFDGTFPVYAVPSYTSFSISVTAADGAITLGATPRVKNAGQVIQDVPSGTSRVYTTADYWKVNDETTPVTTVGTTTNVSSFIGGIAAWCTQCHTRYQTGPSGTYKNASNDAIYTYRHRGNSVRANGYKWNNVAYTNQVNTPNCIQCHVAHGTNAAAVGKVYGVDVTYPGSATVETSSLLRIDKRGVCQMCHNK